MPMQICSRQALHVDHLGRPFWFNGSLRKNKGNGESVEMEEFTHVMFSSINITSSRDIGWKKGPGACHRKGRLVELQGTQKKMIEGVLAEARKADEATLGTNDILERHKEEEARRKQEEEEREMDRMALDGWNTNIEGDEADVEVER